MASYGIQIDGISSDLGFKINDQPYAVDLMYDSKFPSYWRVNTSTHRIEIMNSRDYDEVHRILLAAQLQYHSDKEDHSLWQQLYNAIQERRKTQQSKTIKQFERAA